MEFITLNNGVQMPKVGYGVYLVPPDSVIEVSALRSGRHTHSSVEFLLDCAVRPAPVSGACGAERRALLPWLLPGAGGA